MLTLTSEQTQLTLEAFLNQPESTSVAMMSYSQFRLEDIENQLQLTIQESQTLVPEITPCSISDRLQHFLNDLPTIFGLLNSFIFDKPY